MNDEVRKILNVLLIAAVAYLLAERGTLPVLPVDPDKPEPVVPSDPTVRVDRVTYVYEKDDGSVPRPVAFALAKLSQTHVIATEFDQHSTNGSGQVPSQYKIALAAARQAGLPALVVQSGDQVVRVVKSPTTEAAVMEAAK